MNLDPEWDEDMLSILNIPGSMLPQFAHLPRCMGQSSFGDTCRGILGDQWLLCLAKRVTSPGSKNTYGTGCLC